jgi:hypothetical protein
MRINLLLITKISSYNSCYTQYLSICYPWLGQHVVGSKHNTLFIKYFNYLKSKNNLLTKQTGIHYFFWGIYVTTTIFIFTDGFFHRYLHYHSVGNEFTNKITDRNSSPVNLLSIIFYPSVSPLVIKIIIIIIILFP